jgi:hypothetical protein
LTHSETPPPLDSGSVLSGSIFPSLLTLAGSEFGFDSYRRGNLFFIALS